MTKNDKDIIYVFHILDAIKKIKSYLKGVDYDSFVDEDMRCDAVVRELEIIGEAANNLSKAFRLKHKAIPWAEITGMRNKLAHEYFGVDLQIVWHACKHDIVELEKKLNKMTE